MSGSKRGHKWLFRINVLLPILGGASLMLSTHLWSIRAIVCVFSSFQNLLLTKVATFLFTLHSRGGPSAAVTLKVSGNLLPFYNSVIITASALAYISLQQCIHVWINFHPIDPHPIVVRGSDLPK